MSFYRKTFINRDNKTLIIIIIILLTLITIYFINDNNNKKIYELAVIIRDQERPKHDESTQLKRGDIWMIKDQGYNWRKIELISYLILNIKLTNQQSQLLLEQNSKSQYRIKIENFKFDATDLLKGQPFKDDVFSWKIVEKK